MLIVFFVLSIFVHEYFRPCEPEFIYALLDVTYHETVIVPVFFAGYHTEHQFLHVIAVLILINKDFFEIILV